MSFAGNRVSANALLLGNSVNRGNASPLNLLEDPGSVEIEAHSVASEMVWGVRSLCWIRWALRRLKLRGSADVIGIIALILLVLIFLRVFGII
jgi:hypothetical protein